MSTCWQHSDSWSVFPSTWDNAQFSLSPTLHVWTQLSSLCLVQWFCFWNFSLARQQHHQFSHQHINILSNPRHKLLPLIPLGADPCLPIPASYLPCSCPFPGGKTPPGAGLHVLFMSYCPVFLPSPHQSGPPLYHLYPEPSQPRAPQAASSLHPLSYPNAPFPGFIFLRGSYHPWMFRFIGICSLARRLFLSGIYASKEKEVFSLVSYITPSI